MRRPASWHMRVSAIDRHDGFCYPHCGPHKSIQPSNKATGSRQLHGPHTSERSSSIEQGLVRSIFGAALRPITGPAALSPAEGLIVPEFCPSQGERPLLESELIGGLYSGRRQSMPRSRPGSYRSLRAHSHKLGSVEEARRSRPFAQRADRKR